MFDRAGVCLCTEAFSVLKRHPHPSLRLPAKGDGDGDLTFIRFRPCSLLPKAQLSFSFFSLVFPYLLVSFWHLHLHCSCRIIPPRYRLKRLQ